MIIKIYVVTKNVKIIYNRKWHVINDCYALSNAMQVCVFLRKSDFFKLCLRWTKSLPLWSQEKSQRSVKSQTSATNTDGLKQTWDSTSKDYSATFPDKHDASRSSVYQCSVWPFGGGCVYSCEAHHLCVWSDFLCLAHQAHHSAGPPGCSPCVVVVIVCHKS